jgi:membrane associated rhomboid family serine protease
LPSFSGVRVPLREKALVLFRRGGGTIGLRKKTDRGGLRRVTRPPACWRNLTFSLAGAGPAPEDRLNLWLLVLTAKRIPHVVLPGGTFPRLYVPALHELCALHEIRAVEAERQAPLFVPPARDNAGGVLFFLFLLLFWHGLRWNWFGFSAPVPPFPESAGAWAAAFGLDVYRFRSLHEFWRAITALTMHVDASHLFSNLGFGLIFFIPLCRRSGLGLGMALAVLAGICGNAANALTREPRVLSIGFSTALFGGVGVLCALNGADIFRHQRRFAHLTAPIAGRGRTAATCGISGGISGGTPGDISGGVSCRTSGGISSGTSGGVCGLSAAFLLALARRLLPPVAAGMALLGFLGGGGDARTDYPAHIWGFCCGIAVTLAALPCEQRLFSLPRGRQAAEQAGLFFLTLALFCAAWVYALFS